MTDEPSASSSAKEIVQAVQEFLAHEINRVTTPDPGPTTTGLARDSRLEPDVARHLLLYSET